MDETLLDFGDHGIIIRNESLTAIVVHALSDVGKIVTQMISNVAANHGPWSMIIEERLLEVLFKSRLPNDRSNSSKASDFILSVMVELGIVRLIKLVDLRPKKCSGDVLRGIRDTITSKDLKFSPVVKHGCCSMNE